MSSYVLQVRYISGHVERRLINIPVVKIGRELGDICLHDREASTRHAKLLFDGNGLFYFDLGSTHGSFDRDGHRILAPRKLKEGDLLRIGGCEIAVERITRVNADVVEVGDNFSDEIDSLLRSPAFSEVNLSEGSYSGSWASLGIGQTTNHRLKHSANDTIEASTCDVQVQMPRFLATTQGTWLERISVEVEDTWTLLMQNFSQVLYTWFFLVVAAAIVRALTGWIPMLGTFAGVMSVVVFIVIGPFAILALGYALLYALMGTPIRAAKAWELALGQPVVVWATLVIALLMASVASMLLFVPGILIGIFICPIVLLEDRRYLKVAQRSFELFRQNPGQILSVVLIGVGLPVVAALSLLLLSMEILGPVSGYMAAVLVDVVISIIGGVAVAFFAGWSSSLYLRLRLESEGEECIVSIQKRLRRLLSQSIEGNTETDTSSAPTGSQQPPRSKRRPSFNFATTTTSPPVSLSK